jgi:S1-C subfamily serine protease
MKFILALVLSAILAIGGLRASEAILTKSFEHRATIASGAIFLPDQERRFHCSGTEIGHTAYGDGVFLTARHCVADYNTYEINRHMQVSFSDDQGGPFYDAKPIYISLNDDLALLLIRDGANIPEVRVRDNRRLRNGDPIFNVSFPLSTGKQKFHGEYMRSEFPSLPEWMLKTYSMWLGSMPMNMTIAHGSSGSGVFSNRQRGLIGVAVGTFEEGSFNIAIPGSHILDFLNDLPDNTVEKFAAAHPAKEQSEDFEE